MRALCECVDHGCPAHKGQECTTELDPVAAIGLAGWHDMVLFRVDMEDLSGTLFCLPCYEDALASGLYTTAAMRQKGAHEPQTSTRP